LDRLSFVAWLKRNRVSVAGPLSRGDQLSVYLRDPDGVLVEITAKNAERMSTDDLARPSSEPTGVTDDMKLIKFDHASPLSSDSGLTRKFLENFVGLEEFGERPNPDQAGTSVAEAGSRDNPGFMRYLTSITASTGMVGKGNIHHIALAVEEDEDQLRIMRRLDEAGVNNSGIIDRFWFKSLYFRDPDYNLLEIATKRPGYAVDEAPDRLGTSLVLPKWLEGTRAEIEKALKETDKKSPHTWPPAYEQIPSPPESIPVGRRTFD